MAGVDAGGNPVDLTPNSGGGGGGGAVFSSTIDTFYGPQGYGTYKVNKDILGNVVGMDLVGLKPDPATGGSVHVSVAPADQTGAFQIYTAADGSVWRINKVTGETQMISGPYGVDKTADPRDKNGDGLDDSSGMALGVYRDSASPTGFSYPGSNGMPVAVLPNGALYSGDGTYNTGGGGSVKTINVQGPQGYGTYILKDDGSLGNFIGDPRAPSASSSGGGGGVSGGGASISTGGSAAQTAMINAASRAASDAAAAAQQAAHDAWQGNQNDAQRNWQAAQNAIDRALKLTSDRAQFELQRTGLVQQQTQQMLNAAQQFSQLVSSTDPLQYRAFLAAGGGDIMNSLFNGNTAVSDEANLGAARTLRAMENPTHIPTWDELFGASGGANFNPLNPPTIGQNGVPVGGSIPLTGDQQNNGVPVGGATNTGGMPAGIGATSQDQINQFFSDPLNALRLEMYQDNLANNFGVGMANFDVGSMVQAPMTAGQRNQLANLAAQNYEQGAFNDKRGPYVTDQQIANVLGVPYGTAKPTGTTVPGVNGTVLPSGDTPEHPGWNTLPPPDITSAYNTASAAPGGFHIDINTGRLVPNTSTATAPNVTSEALTAGSGDTTAYGAKLARGGVVVGGSTVMTGDSHNGKPNEELVINMNPDPRDRFMVVPMRDVRAHGLPMAMQQIAMRGPVQVGGAAIPHAADGGVFGTDSYLNPITTADQPYLDRVRQLREGTDYPNLNPFAADYMFTDPTVRASFEQGLQAAKGVPVASLQAYQQRYQLPGIARGALRIGA